MHLWSTSSKSPWSHHVQTSYFVILFLDSVFFLFLTDSLFENTKKKKKKERKKNPSPRFLLSTTCHSIVHNHMTIAPWRGKMSFEITNTWSWLITWVTLFLPRQASTLHHYTTLPIAHPQNIYYRHWNPLRADSMHSIVLGCENQAVCEECLMPAEEMSGMKPHLHRIRS